jgi:hypothetical protein
MRPVGAELFHADGQTDMTKLIVAFHNFVNVSKNYKIVLRETEQEVTHEHNTISLPSNL